MEANLQHEDLLIKLRAKLNSDKIKLWEPPYLQPDNAVSQSLQDLSKRYSKEFSIDQETVLIALQELQIHSVDRSKANAEFLQTGLATFRVKITMHGEKSKMIKVQKKLDSMGSELIGAVAQEIGVDETRVKLIYNGKVLKATPSLQEQNIKNGIQLMALVMTETPEEMKKVDEMYKEMKTVRDDALLLTESIDDVPDEDEFIRLENQSGVAVELPAAERRSLMVGLTLHDRGRTAIKQKNYSLALVLFLEADKGLSACPTLAQSVDNWGVLQLDIAWCYLQLRLLAAAADGAARLAAAERVFASCFGQNSERLIALKGTAANERILFMRLYLLQGIVAYHQNKRAEAKRLLEKAEYELNFLRVDETSVCALMELGWSRGAARRGLRAAGGDLSAAHHYLDDWKQTQDRNRAERSTRRAAEARQVAQLRALGLPRARARRALRAAAHALPEALRLLRDEPHLLEGSDDSSEESDDTPNSDELIEPDNKFVSDLEAMGYSTEDAKAALRLSNNQVTQAIDLLVSFGGSICESTGPTEDTSNPSTSQGAASKKRHKKRKIEKRKKECEEALRRLTSSIDAEEEEHLNSSLADEEEFLAQYNSLL